jgi:pimeloyl-ACP methyl ester carboxylesterase
MQRHHARTDNISIKAVGAAHVMEIQEHVFHTRTVALNYAEVVAPGAPLVLLHGGNARWQAFESIVDDLAAWHLYLLDLRGHGKSDWAIGHYRLQDYAEDVITFLKEVVGESAYVFGHSLGGMVALLAAAQYPAGVRALAVGDAPLTSQTWHAALLQGQDRIIAWRDLSGGQQTFEALLEILKNTPTEVPGQSEPVPMRTVYGEDHGVFPWLATNLALSDPDLLTALIERFEDTVAGYEMESVLPAIQCPVLLLQADPDAGGLMTDAEVAQALPLLARASHVRLEGVSHVLHNERKEPVMTALQEFFLTN